MGLYDSFQHTFWYVTYRVVYEKPCYLPVELEHRAWLAIRILDYDTTIVGEEKRLQLSEFVEIRSEASKSARLSKKRAKLAHDRVILRKDFAPGVKVFLYDSRQHVFSGKLRSPRRALLLLLMCFLMV